LVIKWIVEKWKLHKVDLDINKPDPNSYTPLMLLCHKGCSGPKVKDQTEGTLKNRLDCAEILVANGANVNVRSDDILMTPLHWAAYNNDVGVLNLLLRSGAAITLNKSGYAPIDLAGFCGNKEAVRVFVDDCQHKSV